MFLTVPTFGSVGFMMVVVIIIIMKIIMLPVSTLELAILPGRGLGDHEQDVHRLGAPGTARLSPS